MDTIKINIEQTPCGYEFCNGAIAVARIDEMKPGQYCNHSRWALIVARKPYTTADSLEMAVDLMKDKLNYMFDTLGLNVEFN